MQTGVGGLLRDKTSPSRKPLLTAEVIGRVSTSASLNKKLRAPVQATGGTVRLDPLPDGANAALDRVEIPQDEVGRISQLLTPGSSFILSDYELSTETGNDTDFIVVMP